MKLVKESIEDILKPKIVDPNDLKAYIDQAKGVAEYLGDEIEAANEDPQHGEERLMQAYQHIDNWYYDLPEFIQQNPEIEKLHAWLHEQCDMAFAMYNRDENMFEQLLVEQKKLALAAGFVIIQNNKILLVHPTNEKWKGSFSIPKGHLEPGEDFLDGAKRETNEEIGIKINPSDIITGPNFVDYTSKQGKLYKRVYYYVVHPSTKITQKHLKLQKSEIDWAGFLSKQDAKKRIHPRLRGVLKYLK